MRFELFVATRYLRAKRRQAFIGVITGISVLGVAAGVASLIVALAINNGFRVQRRTSVCCGWKATACAIGVRCSRNCRSSRT